MGIPSFFDSETRKERVGLEVFDLFFLFWRRKSLGGCLGQYLVRCSLVLLDRQLHLVRG